MDAAAIAKQRLDKYLADKLSGSWDKEQWEFYTFLLEQAKRHPLDRSGFGSLEYQRDRNEALQINRQTQESQKSHAIHR